MGQRHQFFLITPNPIFGVKEKELKNKNLKKIFGKKETSVLAFHHQWLYGNTAAVNVLKVLDFISNFKFTEHSNYHNLFNKEFINNNLIYSADDPYSEWLKRVTFFMELFNHPAINKLKLGRNGVERIHFLNEEQPEMMEKFDQGDNNDGISIIDTINSKYCFMIINDFQTENIKKNDLLYQPLSAYEYVKIFYYPKQKHNELQKMFKPYEVMTKDEIATYWPNYKKINQLIEKDLKKV